MSYVEELKSNYQQRRERLYGGRQRPVVLVRPAPEPLPPPPEPVKVRRERSLDTYIRGKCTRELPRCFHEITRIQRVVCEWFGVELGYILERRQNAERVNIRHIAIYLCCTLTKASASEIGRRFLRNHATVLHAVENVRERRWVDQKYHETLWRLEQKLKEAS